MKPVSKILRRTLAGACVFPLLLVAAGCDGGNPIDSSSSADLTSNAPPQAPPNPVVTVATGDAQTGAVGAQLTVPLTALVTDGPAGPALAGVVVTFATTGGGSVSLVNATTNANGVATTRLTLGSTAGNNTVTATVSTGQSATFTETAVAAPTTSLANSTVASTTALANFQSSLGGVNNGGAAGGTLTTGFRRINWDGVALNGTDFGGDTLVINAGSTVGIPVTRFQSRGVLFDEVYSVSGDGFADVNPGVAGQFPAFTANNIFAPFNSNQIGTAFVVPSTPVAGTPATGAKVRSFGAIFIDVETANTSYIEFFNGTNSLGRVYVPAGASGEAEFVGATFSSAVVTNVVLNLGQGSIFNLQGTNTVTAGNPDITVDPVGGVDQVATDDFVYSEPQP